MDQTRSEFKKKILSKICLPAKPIFGIYDPLGSSYLSQLRVGLSKLNFHKFKHYCKDTVNPMCPTNDGIQDTEHFLLLCSSLESLRNTTRLLMTSQRSLETSAKFRFAPKALLLTRNFRDGGIIFHDGREHDGGKRLFFITTKRSK